MFNKTLNNIARKVEDNLFNPDQPGSPQPWHVPRENVFDITETADPNKTPRVVFTLGVLEADLRNRMEAFAEQPQREVVTEVIRPQEHEFAQTYTLQKLPIKPIIRVRIVKTDGTEVTLREGDDFVIDYKKGEITFREDVHDIDVFRVLYWTDEVVGPATTIHLIQPFSIAVIGEDIMKAEAISAIIVGVVEAFKENILAKRDEIYDGLNVTTLLKPIDIQLVNKGQEVPTSNGSAIMLNYRVPGMMHIAKKVPAEELRIIEKIFHPDVTVSEQDVDVRVDILDGT